MAITYNWTIEQMSCYPEKDEYTNVVFEVHWRVLGLQDQYSATAYGSVALSAPEEDFTPYDELTKDQVLNWVWASGVDKDAYEASVANQIANQVNPPVVRPPLPW